MSTAYASRARVDVATDMVVPALPTWPLTMVLAFYPVWWVLGLADVIWIVSGGLMALYLGLSQAVKAPVGFGLWLTFIVFMLLSASQLDTLSRLLVFCYRASLYVAAGVFMLYLFNARAQLTERLVSGLLTVFMAVTVAGGYLGMLFPAAVFRTPASYVVPAALLNNELLNHMVIRRFAQYNAEGYVFIDPRPSAPFLYTNNWGNAYSLLLPFVVAYLCTVYGTRKFWVVAAILPVSVVPALATLNRGMFLGLGVALIYVAVRYLLLRNAKVVLAVVAVGVAGAVGLASSPAAQDISDRVSDTSTTEDRVEIYLQTLESTRDSPLLGKGGPRPSENPNIPPVGTHGQFWMVLHSHGIPAVIGYVGFFAVCLVRSLRRTDAFGILSGSVVLVGIVETLYYGFLPVGLFLLVIACTMAVRTVGSEIPAALPQPASPGTFEEPASRRARR